MSNNSNYKSKIQFKQQNCNKPHLYKITNLINNKYYYGVHDGSDTENYEGSGVLLYQAYEKYGKENFIKEILMWFDTEDEAYEYEAVVVNEKMINKNNSMCYNLCVGGSGGDRYSCQTPERQAEISQKLSATATKRWEERTSEEKEEISQKRRETWDNKTEAEIAEFSQKMSEIWNNKTEEEKEEISQKRRETWNNKTETEIAEFIQKMSEVTKGENNPMFGQGHKVAGEKNGTYTMFQHPYNPNFKGNSNKISNDIRKNYPNEKQWNQLTIKERQSYKIDRQNASVLIAN